MNTLSVNNGVKSKMRVVIASVNGRHCANVMSLTVGYGDLKHKKDIRKHHACFQTFIRTELLNSTRNFGGLFGGCQDRQELDAL